MRHLGIRRDIDRWRETVKKQKRVWPEREEGNREGMSKRKKTGVFIKHQGEGEKAMKERERVEEIKCAKGKGKKNKRHK